VAAIGKPFYGHADRGVAEYQGAVGWYNFNFWDGDYDWLSDARQTGRSHERQLPPRSQQSEFPGWAIDRVGVRLAGNRALLGDDGMWCPGLSQKAWDGLLSGSFDDVARHLHPAPPNSGIQEKKYLACGMVTGLFGLDCDHGCRSDVHPV
jgi:hypothetical protein